LVALISDLTCEKKNEKLQITFTVLTPSWSNIIIFQSVSNIVVFTFSMWSLTCLVWNFLVTIQFFLYKTYQNVACLFVQFRASNSKKLKTSLGQFEVKNLKYPCCKPCLMKTLNNSSVEISLKGPWGPFTQPIFSLVTLQLWFNIWIVIHCYLHTIVII